MSDQICDIFHRIHPIEIGADNIFKIVTMRTDLFSYLNKMKLMCKQIQLHVGPYRCRILTDTVDNRIFKVQHFAERLKRALITSVGNLLFTSPDFTQVIQKPVNIMILLHMSDGMVSHFFTHIINILPAQNLVK